MEARFPDVSVEKIDRALRDESPPVLGKQRPVLGRAYGRRK